MMIDALLVNGCILTTFTIRYMGIIPERNMLAYHNTWLYITLIFLLLFYVHGLYDYNEDDDSLGIFFKVTTAITLGTISVIALTFVSRDFAFPRTVFLISYAVLLLTFSVWRIFIQERYLRLLPVRNVLLYGNDRRLRLLEKHLQAGFRRRFVLAGVMASNSQEELLEAMEQNHADAVIITDDVPGARALAFKIFSACPQASVYLVPNVYDIIAGNIHHTVIGDVPLIYMSQKPILRRFLMLKRFMDMGIASLILLVGAPFFIAVAMAVKLSSRGPVFYSQDRVGRGGRIFRIFKFRTMVMDAEKETGPILSMENDPRITPLGHFMRKFKIDEFPQLFNVLMGQMSLVGPRPERPEFVREFESTIPSYIERRKVLPGMTGLAQVNGLYESDAEMKLKYDLLYIYNYRPLLDMVILYQTAQHVLRQGFSARETV